jgi:UDP-N-acetylglucosamine--N-acetylmuramyl-(pentapeptide) pyrophosphoryl-undecaprenol N-acetylglucosamine transferase
VLGRANRFLALASAIATSFAEVGGADAWQGRMVETGNPVRPAVRQAAAIAYPPREASRSLSSCSSSVAARARFMSDWYRRRSPVPEGLRSRLAIVQQCRPEDLEGVAERYREISVVAGLQPFFRDLPRAWREPSESYRAPAPPPWPSWR